MSDRYFPASTPTEEELQLILLVRYVQSAQRKKEGFVTVKVRNFELDIAAEPGIILVPAHYREHLRRFLWRQTVFMEVVKRSSQSTVHLVAPASPLVKRYIVYMDGIVEGLLTTARKRQDDPRYRSVLFDMYLTVEFFVGRHEHHVAAQWRRTHPEVVLECQDAFELGSIDSSIRSMSILHLPMIQTGLRDMHCTMQTRHGLAQNIISSW